MASQIELYIQMEKILDQLVDNAKKMKEALLLKSAESELEEKQAHQHEILRELAELNKLLEKSAPGAKKSEIDVAKARVHERLHHFQTLNREFFDHISAHRRVIDAQEKGK